MASKNQDLRGYLEAVEFPTDIATLVTTLEERGAPAEVVNRLNQFPNRARFSDPADLVGQLENIEESGKPTPKHEVE